MILHLDDDAVRRVHSYARKSPPVRGGRVHIAKENFGFYVQCAAERVLSSCTVLVSYEYSSDAYPEHSYSTRTGQMAVHIALLY